MAGGVGYLFQLYEILAINNNGNIVVVFWSKIVTHLLSPELKTTMVCNTQNTESIRNARLKQT